jgi:hypothetical protein
VAQPGWPDEPDEPIVFHDDDDHTVADRYAIEFVASAASDILGAAMSVAVDPETNEVIIHIPGAHIRVTQVVHEEGILKLQMRKLGTLAP